MIETFFRIPRKKDGVAVDFVFNSTQIAYDQNKTNRDLILKARQEGISSQVLADFTVDCGVYENLRAAVISHEKDSTQRLMQKVHFYVSNLRGGLNFKTKYASKNELYFQGTGSNFYVGTAGAKRFGRGDTIHRLHLSELAFWESTEEILTGLFQSVPADGRIVIESTANGVGNRYYDEVQKSLKHLGKFKLHFFPWNIFPEYTTPVTESFDYTSEETELAEAFNLTPGQILWRRMKKEEFIDEKLFKQEYPLTIDEAFIASGWGFFPEAKVVPKPGRQEGRWVIYEEPQPNEIYALGIDTAAGTGRDDSVIEIFKQSTFEQVAEYVSDMAAPDQVEEEAYQFGHKYNLGLQVVEMNSYGLEVLNRLKRRYPTYRIYGRRRHERTQFEERVEEVLGWQTSERTKRFLAADLRVALREGLILHSEYAVGELKTFVEKENGKLEAQEGKKDDCVIGIGLAVQGLKTLPSFKPLEPPKPVQNQITMDKLRRYIKQLRQPYNWDDNKSPWPNDLIIWPN